MKRIDKIVNAYRSGIEVGQRLMVEAVESTLKMNGREIVFTKENQVKQLLYSVGHLYRFVPEQEYIHLLPCFFRSIGEAEPEELMEYDEIAHTWYARFFAWGVSLYITDSMDEWDDWLFDHKYIDADEYGERVSLDELDEYEDDDEDSDCGFDCENCSVCPCGLCSCEPDESEDEEEDE